MATKLTIFQRLESILGSNGLKTAPKEQPTRYNIGKTELIRTTSKAEYNQAKLEAQQNKYLGSVWKKVENGLFQQSMNYETTRVGAYSDFEAMEHYPEIAASLDIMMEESTTLNSKGRMLNVYSDSKRVKGIVEDLLFNRLDLHTSLPMWTRNVCKYGDNFVFLNLDQKNGIVGSKQMPNYEMERREGDLFGMVNSSQLDYQSDNDANKVKFYWRGRDIEFNSLQMAHFRLLGDDRRLPYGTSLLEKARRVWKQLLLSEDSMLVYRVTRAPERRVYKIFVGNIDDADVEQYVNEIANRFKRAPITDPQTGQVDLKYNMLPVWKNTPIPLLDGRTLTIKELSDEWKDGKENYVYSVQDDTHQIVGGKVTWSDKNYTAERMVKITLDDDTYMAMAEEHPVVMRDGSKKRADELKEGDSLMPFYTKLSKKEDGMRIEGYPMVYNPKSGKYVFTHRLVGQEFLHEEKLTTVDKTDWNTNNNLVIHHKDFTKINANPTNLQWIGNVDHINYHRKRGSEILTKYNKSEKKRLRNIELAQQQNWGDRFISYNNSELHTEHNEIRKQTQLKSWSDSKQLRSDAMQVRFDDTIWTSVKSGILTGSITNRVTMLSYINTNLINHLLSINNNKRLSKSRTISRQVLESRINEKGFNTITEFISENKRNHKVKSIEFIGGDDVYCMTVVGPNGEDDRHNFAALGLHNDNSISVSGCFLRNSNDQDYFIPVRSEDAPNPIDTLPGASNLDQIADIEYLQKKLFTALRVPKTFLGFEEAAGEGKNLALQDIRFARTINRIQQAMLQELNKIVIIHLYMLGFEDDLANFTLTLNNPSTQAEMLKVEHDQVKVTLYKDAVSDAGNGFAAMSMTRAKREILGWSDDEIKQDLLEQRMEKAAAAELANSASVIKHTGIFDKVDRIYGDMELALKGGANPEAAGEEGADGGGGGGGGLGGSFGGGGLGGDDMDFGDDAEGEEGDDATDAAGLGGAEGGLDDTAAPAGDEPPADAPADPTTNETEAITYAQNLLKARKTIITEEMRQKREKYTEKFVDRLLNSLSKPEKNMEERVKIYDKNVRLNENINNVIGDIDNLLKD